MTNEIEQISIKDAIVARRNEELHDPRRVRIVEIVSQCFCDIFLNNNIWGRSYLEGHPRNVKVLSVYFDVQKDCWLLKVCSPDFSRILLGSIIPTINCCFEIKPDVRQHFDPTTLGEVFSNSSSTSDIERTSYMGEVFSNSSSTSDIERTSYFQGSEPDDRTTTPALDEPSFPPPNQQLLR